MSERTRTSQIVISDRESGLPFSKGLLASQVMVTGLSPYRAYQVAEEVEIRLMERRRASVTSTELAEVAIEVIGEVVNRALDAFPAAVRVIAEPGRFLVSDAGYFVCRIMGTATRANKRWMHLDAGLFGGIIETAEGLKYKIRTDRAGPDIPWNVAGPTCDSIDVVMRDEPLPSDLQEGDYIYLRNAGAYTTAYASGFNGFPLPEIRVI